VCESIHLKREKESNSRKLDLLNKELGGFGINTRFVSIKARHHRCFQFQKRRIQQIVGI